MHKNPDARTDGIAPSQPGPIATVSIIQHILKFIIYLSQICLF